MNDRDRSLLFQIQLGYMDERWDIADAVIRQIHRSLLAYQWDEARATTVSLLCNGVFKALMSSAHWGQEEKPSFGFRCKKSHLVRVSAEYPLPPSKRSQATLRSLSKTIKHAVAEGHIGLEKLHADVLTLCMFDARDQTSFHSPSTKAWGQVQLVRKTDVLVLEAKLDLSKAA